MFQKTIINPRYFYDWPTTAYLHGSVSSIHVCTRFVTFESREIPPYGYSIRPRASRLQLLRVLWSPIVYGPNRVSRCTWPFIRSRNTRNMIGRLTALALSAAATKHSCVQSEVQPDRYARIAVQLCYCSIVDDPQGSELFHVTAVTKKLLQCRGSHLIWKTRPLR